VLKLYLIAINLLMLGLMAWDKRQAVYNGWRVPEKSFFLLAFMGASPALLVGARLFKHKRRKASFMTIIWLIIFTQIILLWLYNAGVIGALPF
jgi:uncharacterized membrane protein YsdA (DUF1294 family)